MERDRVNKVQSVSQLKNKKVAAMTMPDFKQNKLDTHWTHISTYLTSYFTKYLREFIPLVNFSKKL